MPCEHVWERYDNLPMGFAYPYWRCSRCGVIGYTKGNGYGSRDAAHRKVRIVTCYHRGCSEPAVGRLRGYHGTTKLRWVCSDHQE